MSPTANSFWFCWPRAFTDGSKLPAFSVFTAGKSYARRPFPLKPVKLAHSSVTLVITIGPADKFRFGSLFQCKSSNVTLFVYITSCVSLHDPCISSLSDDVPTIWSWKLLI